MAVNSKITDAELEIMQIVWDRDRPLTFREICEAVQSGAKKVTIQTLISRLVEKGALLQDKRDVYYYSALVPRQDFEQARTEELIQKVYRGDVKKLFAALLENDSMSPTELDGLRAFWREASGDA